MCRFAEKLAEDNLTLQLEVETLRNEIAASSCTLQKMQHETNLMSSQMRNADSRMTVHRGRQVFSLNKSLRYNVDSHSPMSHLQDTIVQLQSRYEALVFTLSKFIPFMDEAVLVEHAANVVFEKMQSCTTKANDFEIDSSEISSSTSIASSLTCSVALSPVVSNALVNKTKPQVQIEELQETNDPDTSDTFANVASYRVASHQQESSIVSPMRLHGDEYKDIGARSHPDALREENSVEVGHCKASDIQSYRDLLESYEHELIAAWSREAGLQKELQSKCATCNNRREDYHVFQQASSCSQLAVSTCDSQLSSTSMIVLEAEKILLETKIPSSDNFINDVLKLQEHELFHVLAGQIAKYRSMNRVVPPS
jgi:hypothetical protein